MLKKSLMAAGALLTILSVVGLTACGSGGKQEETTPEVQTVVAQDQTTAADEKVITDKNNTSKNTGSTEKETTTKAPEKETTTKAPEKETTTKAKETEAPAEPAAAQQGGDDTAVDYSDDGYQEEEAYNGYSGVVSADGDGLTLRSGPDSDNDFLAVIPDGTQLDILDVQDGWGYVSFDGYEGWVSLDYVE